MNNKKKSLDQTDEIFKLKNDMYLVGCYHPSPRNVNTGRIDEKKMPTLLKKVLKLTK